MIKYEPNQEIPKLTTARESLIKARLGKIRGESLRGPITDAKWFEVRVIEAILAAASNPLKTLEDTWGPVSFRIQGDERVKGWSVAKMQQHFATAADVVIRMMTA